VFVSGDYAFVADSYSGLRVVDVSNKSDPSLSTTVSGLGTVYDVFVYGTDAYAVAGTGSGATAYGLHVIDASTPASASLTETFDSPYQLYRLVVDENFVYNAMYYGITTVDRVKGPKMNKTRVSAKSFVNYDDWEEENDQLGMFSFSSTVSQDQTLVVATPANKAIVGSEIDALLAYGGTAIGDAMDSARDELISVRGNPDAVKFIVLLTDGQSNYGSDPVTVANSVAGDNVLVYTIGFGQDADTATLEQIASITGAEYYFAGDQNALTEVYARIAGDIGEILATGSTEAFDSNVVFELPAGTQIVDLSNGQFVQGDDSNFVSFSIGFIDSDSDWSDYFTVTFDCGLDSACEQSQLTFPGDESFFYYENAESESQDPVQWTDQKTINFKYRDLKLSILEGTITQDNEIFIDLKALNAGMLSAGSTSIKFYLDEATGSPLEILNVPATDAGEAVYFYDEELGAEGLIVAVINQDEAVSECPAGNTAKIMCTAGKAVQYYLVKIWTWKK